MTTSTKMMVILPSKPLQFVIFLFVKERGYFNAEGIDLNIIIIASTAGNQAVLAEGMHFSGSHNSAPVAVTKGNAPPQTIHGLLFVSIYAVKPAGPTFDQRI